MRCNKCLGGCVIIKSNTTVNTTTRIYQCKKCGHVFSTYETKNVPYSSDNKDYIPACPKGYDGCPHDPAYIRYEYPNLYISRYGNVTIQEAIKNHVCMDDFKKKEN